MLVVLYWGVWLILVSCVDELVMFDVVFVLLFGVFGSVEFDGVNCLLLFIVGLCILVVGVGYCVKW